MSGIHFKKNISTFSLTMTGLTSIVGSGWLLGTQKLAEITGPASIFAWIIGAAIALIVGLFYVEIGSAFPSAGGIGYYSHITHGRFCGFLTSWINWLSIVAVPPIEAQAVIQYMSQINASFMTLYTPGTHDLTSIGIAAAIGLMLVFMLVNYWSVSFFIRFNNFFTVIKVVVPLLTIICLIYSGLHASNFGTNIQEFVPYGPKSIMIGVITCGVVMSFNGFQSPMTFSEEISNPKKMLPIAVISSVLIALVLYVVLQVVFIGSVEPNMLAQGWAHVNYRSPYVELLLLANMQIMATIIYAGSVISPGVCGVAFMASGSRIMYSLSHEKHLPAALSRVHPIYKNPRNAIIACTLIGCLFLFLFKGWYALVAVISVLHIFSYLAAPIITIANRTKNKDVMAHTDQFKLKGAYILAPILMFVLSTLLFYAAWPLTGEMLILILPGLAFFFYYERKWFRDEKFSSVFKGASWLIIYILGISLIAFLGDNPVDGNMIDTTTSMILLAVLSVFTYVYGAFYAVDKKHHDSVKPVLSA
jgi:amino acid transporter